MRMTLNKRELEIRRMDIITKEVVRSRFVAFRNTKVKTTVVENFNE